MGTDCLPAFPGGVRAGNELIGPALLGVDPRELAVVNRIMDTTLLGHPYVKSGIDMACWDILGKAVEPRLARPGTVLEVVILEEARAATVLDGPAYDPTNARTKS